MSGSGHSLLQTLCGKGQLCLLSAAPTRRLLSIGPSGPGQGLLFQEGVRTQLQLNQTGLLGPALFVIDLRDLVHASGRVACEQLVGKEGCVCDGPFISVLLAGLRLAGSGRWARHRSTYWLRTQMSCFHANWACAHHTDSCPPSPSGCADLSMVSVTSAILAC